MLVLGLILVALAVLLGLGVAVSSTGDATLEVFGAGIDQSVSSVFFAGVATTAVLLGGLWLLKKGTGRTYRRRKEVKELRQQVGDAPATTEVDAVGNGPEVEDGGAPDRRGDTA